MERPDHAEPVRAPETPEAARLSMLNDAIVPAALAASAYSARCWALDAGAGLVDPAAWADDLTLNEDKNGLARAMLVAKTCKALSPEELRLDPAASGATLAGGVWRNGDLASALACVRTKEDGTRELHLSIRGTEPENNPNPTVALFQTVAGYLAWTYPSIDKHAEKFTALADAMRDYAADPANGISKIVVSGHSLGAAAAEKLLPRMQVPGIPLDMFGFGSPGRGAGVRAPWIALAKAVEGAARLATHGAALATQSAADLAAWVGRLSEPSPSHGLPASFGAFSCLAQSAARKLASLGEALDAPPPPPEPAPAARIVQFRHPEDPVPKLGSLLYSTAGSVNATQGGTEFVRPGGRQGSFMEIHGLRAHSSDRYARAVLQLASQALATCRAQASPISDSQWDGLRDMARGAVDAARIFSDAPADQLPAAVQAARDANAKALASRDPADPTVEWISRMPAPSIAEKLSVSRALRKFDARRAAIDLLGGAPADLASPCVLPARMKR